MAKKNQLRALASVTVSASLLKNPKNRDYVRKALRTATDRLAAGKEKETFAKAGNDLTYIIYG